MINRSVILGLAFLVTFCLSSHAQAIDIGTNVTIPDGVSSGTGWYGSQEDNEVEPGNVTSQAWDLEGFFLKGAKLTMVGGYNFINGVSSGGKTFTSGDIFLDTNGDAVYGNAVPRNVQTSNGVTSISSAFYHYEYALDLDFPRMQYSIYEIDSDDALLSVYFDQNDRSNPWQYGRGGDLIGTGVIGSGMLTTAEAADLGFKGDGSSSAHNYITVDLSFISGEDFISHFSMECGNDDLMGQGHVNVPEPGSLLLLGFGIFAAGGMRRFFQM